MIKNAANILTSFRILGSVLLLFFPVFSEAFYSIYLFCGFSDMIDGRESFIRNLKDHTADKGIHALNVFVKKPFIDMAPDSEEAELKNEPWYSGELMQHYHDWVFYEYKEEIFDCNSGGIPHKHCMNKMLAEKPI